jgi:hypothetical protein
MCILMLEISQAYINRIVDMSAVSMFLKSCNILQPLLKLTLSLPLLVYQHLSLTAKFGGKIYRLSLETFNTEPL